MTSTVPDHFELYALAVCFLLALGVVALGAFIVVRRGLALKKQAETFKRLPFAPVLELTQARVDIATRSIEKAPELIARARRAFATIAAARDTVASSALDARDFVRSALSRG